jgi:hypothetical protein
MKILKKLDELGENLRYDSQSMNENENTRGDFVAILKLATFKDAEEKVGRIPNKRLDHKYSNYFKNFRYFHEKLEELEATKLNEFAQLLLEKCQVIEIRSWKVEQAIEMFNSLNSKG